MSRRSLLKPGGKAVLVTGCSSGIGRATAIYLARKGFTVFATVRKEEDAEALAKFKPAGLLPVCPLDLTRLDQIRGVADFVRKELEQRGIEGLYAVVHNAGGGTMAPIELMEIEKFRAELETRLVGPVALTQALLPMLRLGKGRIVWIATPALVPLPYVACIHAPDFAVNCLARTLNLELAPWRIPNILVRCGGVKTAAPGKNARELAEAFARWPDDERSSVYKAALRKEMKSQEDFDRKRSEPELIAAKVYLALCAKKPKVRYRVGYMSGLAAFIESLPQSWADAIMSRR